MEKPKIAPLEWTALNHPNAKSFNRRRFLQLAVGILVASCVGTSYCFGIISNYLKERYCLSQGDVTTISTAGAVAGYLSLPFGILYDFAGPKPVLLLAGLVCSLGFAMLALIFNGHIPFTLTIICAVNAVTNFGTSSMDTGSLMSNLYSFPLNRGECIIIQKTFMGLGATFLSLVYQGFFMDDANFAGYATFVSSFVALSLLAGAIVTTLPQYHVTTLSKWRYWRETRRRMATSASDDIAYAIEKDRKTEWDEHIEKSFSQSHEPKLVDRRRLAYGLTCLWVTLVFFTTLAFVNSYVALDRPTRIAMGVLAILLILTFFGMVWPWDMPAFFDYPWLPALTFDKEKYKKERGYTPSARTARTSHRESASSVTGGNEYDVGGAQYGPQVHTSIAATYAISEVGTNPIRHGGMPESASAHSLMYVGPCSYSSSLQKEGIPTYGDIVTSRAASRLASGTVEVSRNNNPQGAHFNASNIATGPAKKNHPQRDQEENIKVIRDVSEPIIHNTIGSPNSAVMGLGVSVAASGRSAEGGNDSLNGDSALAGTFSPNATSPPTAFSPSEGHQTASPNYGTTSPTSMPTREREPLTHSAAHLLSANNLPSARHKGAGSGESTPATVSTGSFMRTQDQSNVRLQWKLKEVVDKENEEKDRLLAGYDMDDDDGSKARPDPLSGDLGMGATDVVIPNSAALQTSFLHNLFKTPILISFWWINFAVWGTCAIFVNNVTQMYRSVNDGQYNMETNALYIAVMGIGSALGRVCVGYIEMAIQKRKAKRETARSLKLRDTGLAPETEPLVEHEVLSSVTILLPLPPLLATITAFLMAISPPWLLGILFAANAFAFGSSWAIFILAVREMFAVDVGKNYNFCFTSGIAASFALNRYMFGEWYDQQTEKQRQANPSYNTTTAVSTDSLVQDRPQAFSQTSVELGACPSNAIGCSGNICIKSSMLVLGALSFTAFILSLFASWWWLQRKRRLIKH